MEATDIQEAQQNDFVKKYGLKLLRRWPKILLFFIISLLLGYAVNRYATPVYLVKARITTKKFSEKPETPIPGLVDASFFLNGLTEVYEEIPILKSPKRISATLDKVDFRISYFSKGIVKNSENLKGFGFTIILDTIMGNNCPFGVPIYVNYLDPNSFQLNVESDQWNDLFKSKTFRVGEPFKLGDATLRLNGQPGMLENDKFFFVINSNSQLVADFTRRLNINWAMKGSAMLDLGMETELPDRELKFLNAYYQVVEEFGLREKNETLDNTIRFIDEQMKSITDSLLYYQSLIDDVKFSQSTLKIPLNTTATNVTGSDLIFASLKGIDLKKAEIELNERYLDYLIDYFQENREEDVFAPSLMGLKIPLLEGWVNQFIQEKLTEKSFRNEGNQQNPLLSREDSLRRKLEKGIYEAIESERTRNKQTLNELDMQTDKLLSSVPDVQVEFRQLAQYQRLYTLNQGLFDLFIRRKTEAAISKASATSDYEVIDAPYFSHVPIRPDRNMNLLIAAAIGLILPIGFFLWRDVSNKKIMDKDDLLEATQMPNLGNVAHSDYPSRLVMKEHPRSVVAESFRAVRANLKFLAADITTPAHTFLVTSSVGGEGKTFCSLNLAYTLALSQKKTIVIGADLRKPELGNYIQLHSEKGLSGYLAGYATLEEVIVKNEENYPDIIDAGKVPPNPAELLSGKRMTQMMGYLKEKYEYILIDTPPIGLVSDAMELFKYSDYNIMIVRQGVTHKDALGMVNELYMDGKLKNFSVLFNDIELFRNRKSIYGGYIYGLGYGGYGYGYYDGENGKNEKNN
jgi:capsular exopolysaccharide synthesis family protein